MNKVFADWIEAQLESREMTRPELADRLGYKYKDYMVEVRTDPLNEQFVWKVANILPVENAYQAAGLNDPYSVQTAQEGELLCLFRQLQETQRENVLSVARSGAHTPSSTTYRLSPDIEFEGEEDE